MGKIAKFVTREIQSEIPKSRELMAHSSRNLILAKRVVLNVRKTLKRENLGVIRAMKWRQ